MRRRAITQMIYYRLELIDPIPTYIMYVYAIRQRVPTLSELTDKDSDFFVLRVIGIHLVKSTPYQREIDILNKLHYGYYSDELIIIYENHKNKNGDRIRFTGMVYAVRTVIFYCDKTHDDRMIKDCIKNKLNIVL